METLGQFFMLLSLGVFIWACIGLFRPSLARLPNRAAAVGVWVLSIALLAVALLAVGGSMMPDPPPAAETATAQRGATAPTAEPEPPPPPPPPEDLLALESMQGADGGYGFHTVEGQVTNLTGRNLENVMAVVTWLTDDDQFITADEALIDFNPVLPGQTSPFEVMSSTNPAMSKYRVEFKTLFGGTLRYEDRR